MSESIIFALSEHAVGMSDALFYNQYDLPVAEQMDLVDATAHPFRPALCSCFRLARPHTIIAVSIAVLWRWWWWWWWSYNDGAAQSVFIFSWMVLSHWVLGWDKHTKVWNAIMHLWRPFNYIYIYPAELISSHYIYRPIILYISLFSGMVKTSIFYETFDTIQSVYSLSVRSMWIPQSNTFFFLAIWLAVHNAHRAENVKSGLISR